MICSFRFTYETAYFAGVDFILFLIGDSVAADKGNEKVANTRETSSPVSNIEHREVGAMAEQSGNNQTSPGGTAEEPRDRRTDSFVVQSELEQKIHNWIVKLGLNKVSASVTYHLYLNFHSFDWSLMLSGRS